MTVYWTMIVVGGGGVVAVGFFVPILPFVVVGLIGTGLLGGYLWLAVHLGIADVVHHVDNWFAGRDLAHCQMATPSGDGEVTLGQILRPLAVIVVGVAMAIVVLASFLAVPAGAIGGGGIMALGLVVPLAHRGMPDRRRTILSAQAMGAGILACCVGVVLATGLLARIQVALMHC